MKIPRSFLAVVFSFVAACDGCGSKAPPPADKGTGPGAQAVVPPEEAPEKLGRIGRLNTAMQCLRRHSAHVFEAQRTYLEKADAEKGAAAGVKPVMLEMYGIDDCRDATTRFTAASPAMPEFDVPLKEYVATLQEYGDAFRALTAYHQTGESRKDKGQRGSELHARVMRAFTAFLAAHDALEAQVNGGDQQAKRDEIEAREKAGGRNLEVIAALLMLEAENLYRLAAREPVAIYGAALDARIAAFAPLMDELTAYSTAHPDEAKARGGLPGLLEHARAFLEASRAVATKLHEGGGPGLSERQAVTVAYNALVGQYDTH